jgi:hypothetical protein
MAMISLNMSAFIVGSFTPRRYSFNSVKKAGSSSVARILRKMLASGTLSNAVLMFFSIGVGFIAVRAPFQ